MSSGDCKWRFSMYALAVGVALCVPRGADAGSDTGIMAVRHVTLSCRIYVDETGVPKTAEIVSIEPDVVLDENAKRQLLSISVFNRTFTPNSKDGKPVAGSITVPVDIDFDQPLPLQVRRP